MTKRYSNGYSERGVRFIPTQNAILELPTSQEYNRCKYYSGDYCDSTNTLHARCLAVVSKFGDACLVFGMTDTTQSKFEILAKRLDEIAQSFRFTKPLAKLPEEVLPGKYYGNNEQIVELGNNQTFSWCDEGKGTFECIGSDLEGEITLYFENGQPRKVRYVFDTLYTTVSFNGEHFELRRCTL
jgi:hypothetical protein